MGSRRPIVRIPLKEDDGAVLWGSIYRVGENGERSEKIKKVI